MSASLFKKLSQKYRTPYQVQKMIRSFPYNQGKPETLYSASETWRAKTAHCLEGTFLAAAILEQRGYPPLVLSMNSIDFLDHVVYIFKTPTGWGSIGSSRVEGLHGRQPIFRSARDLLWSYMDAFVDMTGRISGYTTANLDDSQTPWRDSKSNVWKAEEYLNKLRHKPIKTSEKRYRKSFQYYHIHHKQPRQSYWW